MSYIVSNQIIENILWGMLSDKYTLHCQLYGINSLRPSIELGQELLDLNILAYKQADGVSDSKKSPNESYLAVKFDGDSFYYKREVDLKFQYTLSRSHCTLLVSYAALSQFIVECSDGDISEQKLFKDILLFKSYLANSIICGLPDYKPLTPTIIRFI